MNFFMYSLLALAALIYLFFKKKFSYWKDRGVITIDHSIPLGNMRIRNRRHFSKSTQEWYQKFKENKVPFGGVYLVTNPIVIVTDMEMVQNILVKDFSYFHDRGVTHNEKVDPLSAHLFHLEGQKWKTLRSKLSPTFTSGKMKFMYPTIVEVAERFKNVLSDIVRDAKEIEIKDLLARFTTDIIGTCAFGIECNSLKDPNAEFRKMGRKIFQVSLRSFLIGTSFMALPSISKKLKLKMIPTDVHEFFMGTVKETVDFREKNKIKRNDFMDLLIQLKVTGQLEGENPGESLTIEQIAAQAFVFFLAGFETSSTTLTFCLYELALNQDIQTKLRQEINRVLEKHNGELTYETIMAMTYVDQVLNETLRKYSPLSMLMRCAAKDYPVPGTKYTLEKGIKVWIPAHAIHHDPEIYPDPEKFDPDRFTPEAIQSRPACSFLAFGDGPRNCVGLRFGMMQSRVGLVTLIKNFRFSFGPKSTVPLKISENQFILSSEGGMWLSVEEI